MNPSQACHLPPGPITCRSDAGLQAVRRVALRRIGAPHAVARSAKWNSHGREWPTDYWHVSCRPLVRSAGGVVAGLARLPAPGAPAGSGIAGEPGGSGFGGCGSTASDAVLQPVDGVAPAGASGPGAGATPVRPGAGPVLVAGGRGA